MAIIQTVLSLIILGILYKRMTRREKPAPVSKGQAFVPILLGVVSLPLSFMMVVAIGLITHIIGIDSSTFPLMAHSVYSAFFGAGLPEEIAKLLTLFEEFLYGGGNASAIGRLFTIAAHMIFGILMAKHLGLARYYKINGQGSPVKERILAILIPIAIHTFYDFGTAGNKLLGVEDDVLTMVGLAIAIVALIVMFALQIIVLVRFKKITGKYCGMCFSNGTTEEAEA